MRRRTFICRDRADVLEAFKYTTGYNYGLPLEITIGEKKPRRSLKQNGRFHAWCDILADVCGNETFDKARMKDELKRVCECPETEYVGLDGEIRTERSTRKLSTKQMMDFEDRIHRFASVELGIVLPMTKQDFADALASR